MFEMVRGAHSSVRFAHAYSEGRALTGGEVCAGVDGTSRGGFECVEGQYHRDFFEMVRGARSSVRLRARIRRVAR